MAEPIIRSLLDTDLYKFTMMQCALHQFPSIDVEYRFKSRKPLDLKPYVDDIQQAIEQLCQLTFSESELNYLASLTFFKPQFVEYLRHFQLHAAHIHLTVDQEVTLLIKGPWVETILFEVPLLAIISEIYHRAQYPTENFSIAKQRLTDKIAYVKSHYPGLRFSDFGTRRRFSHAWQAYVIQTLHHGLPEAFIGTSNLYFAQQMAIRPIGTMAHEYLQACQVLAPHIVGSQKYALQMWLKEYPYELDIALTDVLTMDIFLEEFDANLANRYQGLRQDSGDPFVWGDKALQHYHALGIDAKHKSFVFSDNLNIPLAIKIAQYFAGKCYPVFGIGTHLTNDLGHEPLDIVIKMTYANQRPVVKISDSRGKMVCEDPIFLQLVKKQFNIKD